MFSYGFDYHLHVHVFFPDEDAELRRQIDDDVGVDVDRAAAGHRVSETRKKRDVITV